MSDDPAEVDWALQMGVWSCAITGDVCERSALIAEGRSDLVLLPWDGTERDLRHRYISVGREVRPVERWTALGWLTEHFLRGHLPYPGLRGEQP